MHLCAKLQPYSSKNIYITRKIKFAKKTVYLQKKTNKDIEMARFKRILLKLSGESLAGDAKQGIDTQRLNDYARQIKEIHDMGVQIGIVIGGGNIFRGIQGAGKGLNAHGVGGLAYDAVDGVVENKVHGVALGVRHLWQGVAL